MATEKKTKVSCLFCGITNYAPPPTRGKKVVCGKCKGVLPIPGEVVEPSPKQAYELFQKSTMPLLVDFFSLTCMSSELMHSVVLNLAERRMGELMVVRINIEEHPELAVAFGVGEASTFLIYYKGNERDRFVGEMTETDFALWVAKYT